MFDIQQVNEYRKVKAPEELRQQVLQAATKRHSPRHRGAFAGVAALAACLALVLGLHFAGLGGADVLLMGEPLKEGAPVVLELAALPRTMAEPQNGPAAYSRQTMPTQQVELELNLKDTTRLEVSDGYLMVLQNGEAVDDWTALHGKVTVLWEIDPAQVTNTYQLEMYGGETCRKITLSYEENQGGWIAQINP